MQPRWSPSAYPLTALALAVVSGPTPRQSRSPRRSTTRSPGRRSKASPRASPLTDRPARRRIARRRRGGGLTVKPAARRRFRAAVDREGRRASAWSCRPQAATRRSSTTVTRLSSTTPRRTRSTATRRTPPAHAGVPSDRTPRAAHTNRRVSRRSKKRSPRSNITPNVSGSDADRHRRPAPRTPFASRRRKAAACSAAWSSPSTPVTAYHCAPAIYSSTSSAPVIELTAGEVSYGPVSASVFEFSPPSDAKVVEVGQRRRRGLGDEAAHAGQHPKASTTGTA